ncbi:DUF3346 domain-containing protein [Vibrio lentus]|nr:DUF3346 domain-containing protein [Vibrio lentus]
MDLIRELRKLGEAVEQEDTFPSICGLPSDDHGVDRKARPPPIIRSISNVVGSAARSRARTTKRAGKRNMAPTLAEPTAQMKWCLSKSWKSYLVFTMRIWSLFSSAKAPSPRGKLGRRVLKQRKYR